MSDDAGDYLLNDTTAIFQTVAINDIEKPPNKERLFIISRILSTEKNYSLIVLFN
jgi:hypothetical protein